eukprot:jgi/Mesen1/2545/ME000161S01591
MQRSFSYAISHSDPNGKPDPPALRKWIVAICSIRFDLEQGQLVEACFPPGALSPEEESDVAFSSFPDSMSSVHNRASLHDTLFFFRVRRRGTAPGPPTPDAGSLAGRRSLSQSHTQASRRKSGDLGREKVSGSSSSSNGQHGKGHSAGKGGGGRGVGGVLSPTSSGALPNSRDWHSLNDLSSSGEGLYRKSSNRSWAAGQELDPLNSPSTPTPESYSSLGKGMSGFKTPEPGAYNRATHHCEDLRTRSAPVGGAAEQDAASLLSAGAGGAGGPFPSGARRGQLRDLEITPPARKFPAPAELQIDSAHGAGVLSPQLLQASGRGGQGGDSVSNGEWERAGEPMPGPGSGGSKFLYGFVFNRQRHDERLRRGGEQKSVVVLSERPYSTVFKPLVQMAGPMYFDEGPPALEKIAAYISMWQLPQHGTTMELPCGNVIIRAPLPPAHTLPPGTYATLDDFTASMAPAPFNKAVPQGIFHEADVFGMCRGVLMQLWVLWELLLVGEPLLVIAPSPQQCSEAVAALVSLTAPLPCSMDFRPYFTIHDPDFPALNALREGESMPPMVLGVTNLFFLKALRTLPHVVSVGTAPNVTSGVAGAARFGGLMHPNSQVSSKASPARLQLSQQPRLSPLHRFSPTNILSRVARIRREGPLSLMTEHREALWTNYTPSTKPDTAVLNRLIDGLKPLGGGGGASSPAAAVQETVSMVNNEMLRRHFVELTTNFLAPFGPFLRAAGPPEGASPFCDPPPLAPFDAHAFLESLAQRGPGKFLAKRLQPGSWLELYRRFLEGPNFMPWFQRRRAVAEAEQHRVWRRARARADVRAFVPHLSEVELVDSFAAIERHILFEAQGYGETPVLAKLRGDLRGVFNALPRDVQQMLLFNPQHAALLHGGREPSRLPGRPSLARDSHELMSPQRLEEHHQQQQLQQQYSLALSPRVGAGGGGQLGQQQQQGQQQRHLRVSVNLHLTGLMGGAPSSSGSSRVTVSPGHSPLGSSQRTAGGSVLQHADDASSSSELAGEAVIGRVLAREPSFQDGMGMEANTMHLVLRVCTLTQLPSRTGPERVATGRPV